MFFFFKICYTGNLRNMAIDMGSELDNQNRMVDRINAKVIEMQLDLKIYRSKLSRNLLNFRVNRMRQG